ncbi:hypothetical protein LSTR_LSTR010954 [Laodelphax striatellus]|uniref:Secreted protein n=1 Tax=Laodelphax striatellus TaxID=195883 RepID=A0A482XUU2_LAOST|nr:hypothetical protein LSTR_LSTR010954 [Laodelphax striatellus]
MRRMDSGTMQLLAVVLVCCLQHVFASFDERAMTAPVQKENGPVQKRLSLLWRRFPLRRISKWIADNRILHHKLCVPQSAHWHTRGARRQAWLCIVFVRNKATAHGTGKVFSQPLLACWCLTGGQGYTCACSSVWLRVRCPYMGIR